MTFYQNISKPTGLCGRIMLTLMNAGHGPLSQWGFSHIHVANDAAVLDIGCGGGANIQRLLQMSPYGRVLGVDNSTVSVNAARRRNQAEINRKRCDIVHGNVMSLPFSEQRFDLVTACETIYFWPDLGKAFAQVYRVLRNGGTFCICNEMNGRNARDEIWTRRIDGMVIYRVEQLQAILTVAGFGSIQVHENEQGWVCLTARKAA